MSSMKMKTMEITLSHKVGWYDIEIAILLMLQELADENEITSGRVLVYLERMLRQHGESFWALADELPSVWFVRNSQFSVPVSRSSWRKVAKKLRRKLFPGLEANDG